MRSQGKFHFFPHVYNTLKVIVLNISASGAEVFCVCLQPKESRPVFWKVEKKIILANEHEKSITEILHFILLTLSSNAKTA